MNGVLNYCEKIIMFRSLVTVNMTKSTYVGKSVAAISVACGEYREAVYLVCSSVDLIDVLGPD